MAGQNHHFVQYAPERIPYATERYVKETNRLYGVLNRRLADRLFIAGEYSIADMASYPWIVPHKAQAQNLDDFPHLRRWFETMRERPFQTLASPSIRLPTKAFSSRPPSSPTLTASIAPSFFRPPTARRRNPRRSARRC